jgi:clan AA aspartic protease (TIGR02281 family)
MFRWTDEGGVVHFTDNPHNVPENHRANASRIEVPVRSALPGTRHPEKVSIPLEIKGQVAVVSALLNRRAQASFIVDTGATYTIISRATAKELEIDLGRNLPEIRFQTANGIIIAPVVSLDSIEVKGMRVNDLTVAVHDFSPDQSISGLLGLNFLSRFRMDIDTQSRILVLEKK